MKGEGVVGLWVGFPTYYFRIAPHAMIVKKKINLILLRNFFYRLLCAKTYSETKSELGEKSATFKRKILWNIK